MSSMVKVKLVGGPCNGRIVEAEKGEDYIRVAHFWTYSYAGKKEGKFPLYCIVPRSRAVRRMIMRFISQFGYHPGLMPKQQPYRKVVR